MRTLLLVSLFFLQTQHAVAVMQNPDYPNLVQEARREYLNGQFRNSEKLFLDALRSLDKSNQDERAMLLAELGNVYVGLDLLSKAERELTTAESRFPTVPQKQRIAQARGFISQAIAVRERDLAAAKSLAERAEILSRELAAEMR